MINLLKKFFLFYLLLVDVLLKIKKQAEHPSSEMTIGLMSRVFANGPGDRGSVPGRVIPKTQKVVLDAALLNP